MVTFLGHVRKSGYAQYMGSVLPVMNECITTDYHQRSKSYIYIYKFMNIHSLIRFNIVSISLHNDKHTAILHTISITLPLPISNVDQVAMR